MRFLCWLFGHQPEHGLSKSIYFSFICHRCGALRRGELSTIRNRHR